MKFDFPNKQGEILSGKLEMPKGKPQAFALFAHCFTCSKDFVASNTISKTLAENGIAVLRFDFTGLGNSHGDFANTNFSSNVEDLVSACEQLGKNYQYPQILIGHSLGGAAVLKAATQMKTVKAVVTIAAPSCTSHVSHFFEKDIEKIENDGEAEVSLVGRKFTIKKQFIDDIKEVEILEGIKNFKKALLVMHSPTDNTVSIEHASNIFHAAKHPKSFVTLDNMDHLLLNKKDADYVGRLIASWMQRYIPEPQETEKISIPEGHVVVKGRADAQFTQDIYTSDHHIIADEPPSVKGGNLGMTPYELLLAGLGACTSMTVKMYARHKNIKLNNVTVSLSHEKIHANDCEACETSEDKIDVIHKSILLEGDFTPEQEKRMHEIVEQCPVNKTLRSEIKIISTIKNLN